MQSKFKIKQLMRRLKDEMAQMYPHDCNLLDSYGIGCLLCKVSLGLNLPLAALNTLRNKHNLYKVVLPAEEMLIDLIGAENYTKKIFKEIRKFRSFPKKPCPNCHKIVILCLPYKHVYSILHYGTNYTRLTARCQFCETEVTFTKTEDFQKVPRIKQQTVETYLSVWVRDALSKGYLSKHSNDFSLPSSSPVLENNFTIHAGTITGRTTSSEF
jgi:hypothetical protein